MKYRLTRQSKNFGKVWWSGESEAIDLVPEPIDHLFPTSVPGISFDVEATPSLSRDNAEMLQGIYNINLGPNSPPWTVEQVA